jgi:hypothetical protein
MDENMVTEVDELIGDHKDAMTAFAFECGNAALEGYKQGCAKRTLIAAGGGLLIYGAFKVGEKIVNKCKKKKLNKTKKYIKVDK